MIDKNYWMVDFVNKYEGNKLSIVATGGGVSLGLLGMVPGSSRIFHSFYCPYETQESVQFIRRNYPLARNQGAAFAERAVCPDSAEELYMALWTKNKVDGHRHIHNIAITAACTTTRYRRGENQAFITFQNQDTLENETWNLKLDKPRDEAEHAEFVRTGMIYQVRTIEDEEIARTALYLASGMRPEYLEQDKADGSLTRVYSQVTG